MQPKKAILLTVHLFSVPYWYISFHSCQTPIRFSSSGAREDISTSFSASKMFKLIFSPSACHVWLFARESMWSQKAMMVQPLGKWAFFRPSQSSADSMRLCSPIKEVARLDTGATASEMLARKTLVWSRAPAAVVRTHPVTHHPLLSCEKTKERR